jgi:hypothetical protein
MFKINIKMKQMKEEMLIMRTIMMHLIIIQAKTIKMKKNNKTVSLNNLKEIRIMITGAKEIKVINLDPA